MSVNSLLLQTHPSVISLLSLLSLNFLKFLLFYLFLFPHVFPLWPHSSPLCSPNKPNALYPSLLPFSHRWSMTIQTCIFHYSWSKGVRMHFLVCYQSNFMFSLCSSIFFSLLLFLYTSSPSLHFNLLLNLRSFLPLFYPKCIQTKVEIILVFLAAGFALNTIK